MASHAFDPKSSISFADDSHYSYVSRRNMPHETSGVDSSVIHATPATIADAPFNLPSADVVFLTADNVEFHAHRVILSIASPFFTDTFSLQQPCLTDIGEISSPIVPVTEYHEIFGILLRLLYPVVEPSLMNRVQVEQVLEASMKYDMKKATVILRRAWMALIPNEPLQAFATACRLRLQDEAMTAARAWKAKRLWGGANRNSAFKSTLAGASYVEGMASLPAGTYFRLLYFLRSSTDDEVNFIDSGDPTMQGSGISNVSRVQSHSSLTSKTSYSESNADITLRSCDGVDIPAHRLILSIASAEGLLDAPSTSDSDVYEVDADADAIRTLLELCYPFPHEVDNRIASDVRMLDVVMRLAQRYRITKVINVLRTHSAFLLKQDPLLYYFLALKWNWRRRECEAISRLLSKVNTRLNPYSVRYAWAMEDVSAKEYVELLRLMHSKQQSIDRPTHSKHKDTFPILH